MEIVIRAQFLGFTRWFFTFMTISIILPIFFFPDIDDSFLAKIFTRYIFMVAILISLGYLLLLLKLYEAISLILTLLIFVVFLRLPKNYRINALVEMKSRILIHLYDFLDGIPNTTDFIRHFVLDLRKKVANNLEKITGIDVANSFLLLFVLGYTSYLTFSDTLQHAAPAMTDYVTLARMKYIDQSMFVHGISPQGFEIFLSILHKFAGCDALYILKYTGPLNGVLATLSMYFFMEKVTGKKLSGILSAFVFGVLGSALSPDWQSQGSTNSLVFGIIFLFLSWYFAISFMKTHEKRYLWTVAAAMLINGYVNTYIYILSWSMFLFLILSYLIFDAGNSRLASRDLFLVSFGSGIVTLLQIIVSLLLGKKSDVKAADLLTFNLIPSIKKFGIIDEIAILGFILFLLVAILQNKEIHERIVAFVLFILGISSLLLYRYIGINIDNLNLTFVFGVFWTLLASIGVGLLLGLIQDNFEKYTPIHILEYCICFMAMVTIILFSRPSLPQPFKIQYDQEINQYLRICDEYCNSEWVMVSEEEGYYIALGKGGYINISNFLNLYDPRTLTFRKEVNQEEPFVSDYFIFVQKKLFSNGMYINEALYKERLKNYEAIEKWIETYRTAHQNLSIYYKDDFIEVYHISLSRTSEDNFRRIWGF
ncbi:hypothetical protein DEAC_c18250 [Desulfosporosinus acididurans]|uniref:Glycosyltransferase RgtA/B/C/D-like domain-containing protein n=1 Tax=Desulfosporosinus acididurans TaxID=476652 RepID=A0A0J1IP35_9FIRM|nr:hypothetical protein [Desulfosporosinus acididurans]KLU66426.1 hypothetical protein DEAC_c18250 [Desulfosporosinus acididurans]